MRESQALKRAYISTGAYLDHWGYPYVMGEFRFYGLEGIAVDAIALLHQDDAKSRFRVIDRWRLRAVA